MDLSLLHHPLLPQVTVINRDRHRNWLGSQPNEDIFFKKWARMSFLRRAVSGNEGGNWNCGGYAEGSSGEGQDSLIGAFDEAVAVSFAPNTSCFRASSRSSSLKINASSENLQSLEKASTRRRTLLVGVGLLFTGTSSGTFAFANEVPENYQAFVDFSDGYSYYYPSEWREFDFRGHDSAFKDRTLPLQNVRVSFKPTDKTDVRDLGRMEEVVTNLVTNIYAAPNQKTQIFDVQERSINGKNYWTFEYEIASSGFSRASFATIAIGNGKYYTLIVGANERRWRKLKDKLRIVADSFKILDV